MALGMYTNVLVVLGAALLLVAAGLGKHQLVWMRRTSFPLWRRRRRSR
jgi:hypothetical protein